ncbi:Flp family type IVb pilin [Terriglobus sp. TAA 43]|uniref:Flp family type IVb pilin n=1 Tax=Terriglobus sp. TAA 43 TaxID=278961 RepID=UPI000647BE58|nr:Flp family type IVb pilin [Terriglobus sp. TAA 43]
MTLRIWKDLVQDESGQDLIEYALIAGLIGAVCVGTLQTFATALQGVFTTISAHFTAIT